MDEQLADILNTCLARIDGGDTVDACLAAYPQQRVALEAPLHAAVQLRALPRPVLPAATRAAVETQMLALAAQRRAAPTPTSSPNGQTSLPPRGGPLGPAALLAGLLRTLGYRGPLSLPWLRLASAAIALVLALVLSAGALAAARAIVQVIQRPSSTPTTTLPPATPFTLDGPIQQIAPESWVVNDIAVAIDHQTTIHGAATLGAMAHISGVLQPDGTMLAQTITIAAPPPTPGTLPPATVVPSPVTVAPSPVGVPTDAPAPMPTATPLPAGATVDITGVIQQITIIDNVTTIVVNDITYVLSPELVVVIGERLRIGVPIVFVGQIDLDGRIIVINVVEIDHQRIIIEPPKQDGDKDKCKGKDNGKDNGKDKCKDKGGDEDEGDD